MENSVRQAMRAAKNAVMQFSEIEVKIRDATSNDPWGPSTTLLAEVARATNNYEDYPKLFHRLWQRLNDTEHVMHVQKSLIVVDYLLRNGAERFINDCKRRARDIAQLKKYKHYDANNQDDAKECRARAKLVYDLLMDDAKIAEERSKASRIRDVRLQGFGSGLGDFHGGVANDISAPNPNVGGFGGGGRRGVDDDDDERPSAYKKAESHHNDDKGKGDANGGDDDGEKKKKKKKKKEKKEDGEEEAAADGGEGDGEGEKKKKKKKKKKPEGEEGGDAPRKPSFADISSSSAFPAASSSHDPFASSSSSDPFGSAPSAASAYAAVVNSSSAPSEDIFSKLAVATDLSSHRSNGEIDFVTGGGNGVGGEDLSNLFSSSLTVSGNESNNRPSPHRSPMAEPAIQVFGQKRSDLWESDLLNIDNIKDEDAAKKKSSQPKEQQMTMGMMRSIQPLGSAPPKQNNSHRKSGIVPPSSAFPAGPTMAPTVAPMGMGGGMGYGVAPMMAPVTPMGMAPMGGMAAGMAMAPMGGMGMQQMGGMGMGGMGGMGMGGMGMSAMGGMVGMGMQPMGGMGGMGMGGGMVGRSVAGPHSATNDIFFK